MEDKGEINQKVINEQKRIEQRIAAEETKEETKQIPEQMSKKKSSHEREMFEEQVVKKKEKVVVDVAKLNETYPEVQYEF